MQRILKSKEMASRYKYSKIDNNNNQRFQPINTSFAILYKSKKNPICNAIIAFRIMTFSIVIGIFFPVTVLSVDPKFDPSTRMRLVLVPADAQVGSVIYRLRATDEEFDYPLVFEFVGDASSSTVKIESLPCTKYNSVCQANVVLQRRLEPGRYYDFQVSVKDTKGGMATQLCSITATNFTTPQDLIFPHKPGIIMVPEDAKRGTELDYVIARKNPLYQKPVYLELWGSPLFAIRQKIVSAETTEGTIFLLGPLDFEKQAMFHLAILANDAYAEPGQDSRNIAGMEIVVIVQDVQDQPPVFTSAPPVTKLTSGILPGDKILQVHAEDGDKGNPRDVRYGLVSEGNPFTSFFDINDTSGEIFLMRPVEDIAAITHIGDPILLTVVAEELKTGRDEPPAMASTVQLAFFLPERTNSAPYFENDHYVSRIDENAPQGTALSFIDPYVPRVFDDDTGKNGVFSLTLLSNNGTFEITPNVAERTASFLIRVRDNVLLDYEERRTVQFQILAQELGPSTNLSATVNVTVYINDVNDNPPMFENPIYTAELPENMTIGTKVVHVHANDVDSGLGGKVRYTAILGYLNTSLNLDSESGLITVSTNNHGFDRETMPEYHLYVEAKDNDGSGNRAQVPLIIKLIDVNDETPTFEKDIYEFILAADLLSFTMRAFIHANDKDATAPNNEVRYELINGNYDNYFLLDKFTGELSVREKINLHSKGTANAKQRRQVNMPRNYEMFILTARAYDLGVPVRFSTTIIQIYPPESRTRVVTFVVPGLNPDKTKTEETLSTITGGKVIIHEIRELRPDESGAFTNQAGNAKDRSVVTATVLYDSSSVVDISQIQHRLSQQNSSFAIMAHDTSPADNLTPLQTLYKAENKLLFWLLILLAILVAVTILILLLCCICSWCPLYGAASKRIVNISRTEDDVHLVHREMANGKQTKSVQVAEWMGRHEAWSAEKPSDPRTKPTRWEFHNGREQSSENIEEATQVRPAYNSNPNRIRSAGERSKNIKIRNFGVTKDDTHLSFHNSRTNLINDPDLYVEDINNAEYEGDTLQQIKIRRHQPEQRKTYDVDSIQHHDIERGSDIDVNTARSTMKNNREFFIKDGNIEILHLMTRDKAREGVNLEDENIYINVPPRNLNLSQKPILMVENSGKEILMRRFIEEQPDGKQIIREHYQIVPGATYIQNLPNEIIQNSTLKGETFPLGKSGPNSIVYSQAEPEVKVIHTQHAQDDREPKRNALVTDSQLALSNQSLSQELENTLKQQNELLRQILLEKTRYTQNDLGLETQSLPGNSIAIATQTDCEVGTQTDGLNGFSAQTLTKRRKARSENDDSVSEDDYEFVRFTPPNSPEGVYFIKRRRQKRRPKTKEGTRSSKRVVMVEEIKRKIRTPIREEEEVQVVRKRSPPKKPLRETKTSILRRNKNEERKRSIEKNNGKGTLSDNILAEISDSFDERNSSDEHKNYKFRVDQVQFCSNTENTSGNDIYYDSDPDEIVIRTNSLLPTQDQRKTKENKEKHNFEIHINEKLSNIVSKTPGTTQHYETKPEAKLRLSRKYRSNESLTGHAQKMRKSSIEQTQDRPSMSKYSSNGSNSSSKSSFQKQTNSLKDRAHQSETDLTEQQEMHEKSRNVPKYMDWYYNKKTQQKNDHSPVVTSNQVSNKKKSENSSEKVVSKSSMNTQQKDSSAENLKFKPEPAPRKSPPKVNNLLKEDMKVSKQLTSQVEIDTNHPLLQHSEHRFERENTRDVPIPPTNLPHYMYPETPPLASSKNSTVIEKPSPIKENEIKHSKINSNTTVQLQENQSSKFQSNAHKQLCAATLEDDHDSGIAMNSLFNSFSRRNPIADKKSVFTIAYDDVRRVKKITSGGESPQNS